MSAEIIHLHTLPRVLNPTFLLRLSTANRAARELRRMGCRVLRLAVARDGTDILIDKNPHKTLSGYPDVRVRWDSSHGQRAIHSF